MRFFLYAFMLISTIGRIGICVSQEQMEMTTSKFHFSTEDVKSRHITRLNNILMLLLEKIQSIQASKDIVNPEVIIKAENITWMIKELGGKVTAKNINLLDKVIASQEEGYTRFKRDL
ncbi:uncharacterized protein LOC118201556 isoform X1 [Stegodyphus dumicola]|uniref:uncharacterized protein LOC118201556 isoform X1 n=1 Tax=Stegodyphus dumicola TaxID=202533 RepID=UPI0015AD9112|nr:uncharacterized protein LOC118201556 isoform X1 [Stegodyphus dumicola]